MSIISELSRWVLHISNHSLVACRQDYLRDKSKTMIAPWQPLKYEETIERNLYCPAVSQMWSFTILPSIQRDCILKSTAVTAGLLLYSSLSSVNAINNVVFPTPLSPTRITLNFFQSALPQNVDFLANIFIKIEIILKNFCQVQFNLNRDKVCNFDYFRQIVDNIYKMNQKTLQNQLKNCKVREGVLYKRSRFLKEWRQRWIVLTMNYLFTFTNKTCKQVTDIINVKQIKSYKSYVRKDDQMIPAGFKIRSDDNEFYFCGKNADQKWSWLVTLQRLMDFRYVGTSTYNNAQFITTRGFISQLQFENGGKVQKTTQPEGAKQQTKKQVQNQVQKIMKELQNKKEQLKQKVSEFNQMQKQLKQQQRALKRKQQQKLRQFQNKTSEVPGQKSTIAFVPQEKIAQKADKGNMAEFSKSTAPAYKLGIDSSKNIKNTSKTEQLYVLRAQTVANLFQEFHSQSLEPQALKYALDFLVKMALDSKFGYYGPIIASVKSHENKQHLAQTFVEVITDYKDMQNCDILVKFVQICVFQAPGFFNQNHISIIQNKLLDFLLAIQNQEKIQVILKSMFIVNKINKYQKNQIVKEKINQLVKEGKVEQTKNWARILVDQF